LYDEELDTNNKHFSLTAVPSWTAVSAMENGNNPS